MNTGRLRIIAVIGVLWTANGVMAQPDQPTDYLAEFAALTADIPEGERAYPLYAQAYRMLRPLNTRIMELQGATPSDPDWSAAVALLDECTGLLELGREIAAKPHLGYQLTWEGDEVWGIPSQGGSPFETPGFAHSAAGALMPHLGVMRALCRLEQLQARRCAEQGDLDAAIDSIVRIRAMSDHAAEEPIAINRLVAISLDVNALRTAEDLLAKPEQLGDSALARLRAVLSGIWLSRFDPGWIAQDAIMSRDLFQRCYPPEPTGLITLEGMRVLKAASSDVAKLADRPDRKADPDPDTSELAENFAMLMFRNKVTTHQETLAHWESLMAAVEADASVPSWSWSAYPGVAASERIQAEVDGQGRYSLALIFLTDIPRLARSAEQLRLYRDATITTVALEQYRRARDDWPNAIDQLVPEFLDTVPPDRADGQPLRYHRTDDGEAILYSLGPDRDDDGGVPVAQGQEWRFYFPAEIEAARTGEPGAPEVPDGDFVLWRSDAE